MVQARLSRLWQESWAWGWRFVPQVRRPEQRREVRRIFTWTLILTAAGFLVLAVITDIENPPAPLPRETLLYTLSTIAECAAALAALIGFFGLWRMDRYWQSVQRHEARERDIRRLMSLNRPNERQQLEEALITSRTGQRLFSDLERQLKSVLGRFLLVTLAILALALVGLIGVDALHAWPWTVRLLSLLASVSLAIGPAAVIRKALFL